MSETWKTVVPTGAIDGANTVYSLPDVPDTGTLVLFVNGREVDTALYTLVSSTLTYTGLTLEPANNDETGEAADYHEVHYRTTGTAYIWPTSGPLIGFATQVPVDYGLLAASCALKGWAIGLGITYELPAGVLQGQSVQVPICYGIAPVLKAGGTAFATCMAICRGFLTFAPAPAGMTARAASAVSFPSRAKSSWTYAQRASATCQVVQRAGASEGFGPS